MTVRAIIQYGGGGLSSRLRPLGWAIDMAILYKIPFDKYKFRTITYETE